MRRIINAVGIDQIKQWEGLRTTAYCDVAGVWTIGYGHTAAAGAPVPVEGMTITQQEAEALLRRDLEQYEEAVDQAVSVALTDNQFAALVSFTYNIGIDAFLKSSLLGKLNQGQYEAVPGELMKWVRAGGKRVTGLANRRAAEAGLWVKGDFVSSSSVKPLIRMQNVFIRPETLGPVFGAMASLTSFVTGNGPFQWAIATAVIVACCIGAWYFIRRARREML